MTQTSHKNNPNSSILKDTRLSKGLSLEIVHESTKIPMDALRAIEEGYSTRILTPFYYRGFIKIYAEFLGLNVADVLVAYNAQPSEAKSEVKAASSAPKTAVKKSVPVQKSAVNVPNPAIERIQDLLQSIFTPKNVKNILRVLGVVVALFILIKIGGCALNAIKNKPKTPKTSVVDKEIKKPKAAVKKEAVKEETRARKQESPVSGMMAALSNNQKVSLTVHAPKDTPIQVKADGKIVFQMTMKKGTVENWEASDQIELSGKNIGDLELEVNGRAVGTLATSNRRAKRAVITREGLTVKK